jgi:RimJ/RimL family protein N-acetyltransferase
MIIETDRLILSRFQETDLLDLYEYLSNENVVRHEPYKPKTKEETEEELKWRVSTDEMLAVELKENHKMIGNVYIGKRDFNAIEIGYVFNDKYWKKGHATEACAKIIKHLFDNGVHRIFAECDPNNPDSWRLLEKLGFVREAHLAKNVYFWRDENDKPIWKDTYVYSLLNENT